MNEIRAAKRKRGRPRSVSPTSATQTVQALDRGLQVLRALARNDSTTLSDLALNVGMPPSTAHRVLTTLQNHGFVEFDATSQEWAIGIGAFRIGSAYLVRTNLVEGARNAMRELMAETGETANLGIMEDAQIVFVSQVETQNPIRAFFRPGTRSQMHASGIGKAILAQLPRRDVEKILRKTGMPEFTPNTFTSPEALFSDLEKTAEQGWALDDEEHFSGMRCVAAPVFNSFGEAFAGLSISGPTVRLSEDVIQRTGLIVRRAAAAVTDLIGGRQPDTEKGRDAGE